MKRQTFLFALLLVSVATASIVRAANVSDFQVFSLTGSSGVILPGRLFVPPEAKMDPITPRPFIVFLHGGGESGSNNVSQINANIDNLLAEAKRRGAYLYAPQTANNWSGTAVTGNVMTMIDRAVAQQNVDDARLYITGLSNGGGGTWNMLSRYPDRFAAGVPICGVNPASDFVPANLVDQAIAAFHARNDTVVSVITSRNVINRILLAAPEALPAYPSLGTSMDFVFTASNHDLAYIEPATGGHGIWGAVYNTPQLYDWLLAHTTVPEPALAASLLTIVVTSAIFQRRRARRLPWAVGARG